MLLFFEGFDCQSTAQLTTNGKWSATAGLVVETVNTRFGVGQALQDASAAGMIERAVGSNLATGCIGSAYRIESGSLAAVLMVLYDGTTCQLAVIMNSDRTLSIIRNSTGTVLGTSTYTVPVASYFYLELKFNISDSISSGDVILYVDGTAVITLAAATDCKHTTNAYITKYRLGGDSGIISAAPPRRYIDDHYIVDFTGTINNAPLGSVRVQTLLPSANGNSSGMSGSDGNSVDNYALVDETGSNNGDTDYVEHATAGTKDTYVVQDTASTTSTIFGVQTNIVAKRTDTDNKTIAPVIRIGSTDYDGPTTASINSAFTTYTQLYETKPSNSTAWTKTDVDGAEFGVKVVS